MRKMIAVLSILAVAGCSNVADVRSNPASLSVQSVKTPKVVAECIRDGWQSSGGIGGMLQQSGARFSVIAPNAESPWHVVDIDPAGSGSTIKYHFYRTWQSPTQGAQKVVADCAR